jgi:voltage-dependent calcium channel T type alpha-1G
MSTIANPFAICNTDGSQRASLGVGQGARLARKSAQTLSERGPEVWGQGGGMDPRVSAKHVSGPVKQKRVTFRGSRLHEVLHFVKQTDESKAERLAKDDRGLAGNVEKMSDTYASTSARNTVLDQAGQNTGYLKMEEQRLLTIIERVRERQLALTAGILTGYSCFCFHPLHPIRRRCAAIISNQDFQTFINLVILASCCAMMAERPNIPQDQQEVLDFTNLGFSLVFIAEAVFKIIALGFSIYLRSIWNKLDFFIVLTSIADIVISFLVPRSSAARIIKVAKIMRIFRAVRPLKVVLQSEGLNIVLRAVTDSILPLFSTLIISVLVVGVFAIISMELLQGTMHYCSDGLILLEEECVGLDANGDTRVWRNFDRNFDWFGQAWVTVFIVGTQDRWQEILFAATDSASLGLGRQSHQKEWLFVLFFPMILIVGLFQMNMWTGVFVSSYMKACVTVDREVTQTLNAKAAKQRKKWPKRIDLPILPSEIDRDEAWFRSWRREHGYRLPVKKFCTHEQFDQLIALGIVINIVCMSIQSFKQSHLQTYTSTVQNLFFTLLFGGEVVAKLYALHPQGFFKSGWYQFDYFISILSFAGLAVEESGDIFQFDPTILRILRIFRIIRIIKAAKIFRHAKRLFGTLEAMANAAPLAMSLFFLLISLILIFGVTGVVLYGHLCVEGDENLEGARAVRCLLIDPDLRMGRYSCFKNIGAAALTLFRVTTSDDWWPNLIEAIDH